MTDRATPNPATILQILSSQTRQDAFDCAECDGQGERLIFDPETGSDYQPCEACQGSGYNMLGLLVHGLLQPPAEGYGPQELKNELAKQNRTFSVCEQPSDSAHQRRPATSEHQTPTEPPPHLRLIS